MRVFRSVKSPVVKFAYRYPNHLAAYHRHARLFNSVVTQPLLHSFPVDGFERLPVEGKFEEEDLPAYLPEKFYPVRLGELFDSRYQVVVKLGFGTSSTIWLCRDHEQDVFLALKICTVDTADNELSVSQYLKSIDDGGHLGKPVLRLPRDDFEITGPGGVHQCFVFDPLGLTFTKLRSMYPQRRLSKERVQHTLQLLAMALHFLHQVGVVHTDISPNNILLGVKDPSVFSEMEDSEIKHPSPRKVLPERTIYISHPLPFTNGPPVLCDFGAARIGDKHKGDVMPLPYRAPEVILDMQWDSGIDIWSLGVMIWDLLEGRSLFRAEKDGVPNDELHLAQMDSLMGPPPKDFLARSEKCRKYWDEDGTWIATTPKPDQSFESRLTSLHGEDKALLLGLVRKMLRWLPEERASAQDLFADDFLLQPGHEAAKAAMTALNR